jgi:lysophospholipase L1-like esterase
MIEDDGYSVVLPAARFGMRMSAQDAWKASTTEFPMTDPEMNDRLAFIDLFRTRELMATSVEANGVRPNLTPSTRPVDPLAIGTRVAFVDSAEQGEGVADRIDCRLPPRSARAGLQPPASRSGAGLVTKAVALLTACVATLSASVAAAQTTWTGSWSSAPLSLRLDPHADGLPTSFRQRTLRQTVQISIGGTAARVRLSNLFGTSAVTIQDVRFAIASSDQATIAGTDRPITFGGSSSVVLQPGMEVLSDPIVTTLAANSDVTVSMYFPKDVDTNALTAHRQAWQLVYLAEGDVGARTAISPVATEQNLFFLTGIDVVNSKAAGAVVALGASITDSSNSSFGQNKRWTNLLSRRLRAAGLEVGVLNQGLSGNNLLNDADFGGPSAFHRFERDVLSQANVKWVIFSDDPINDLSGRTGANVPPAEIFTGLVTQMITAAHAKGVRFYCSTLTPNGGRPADAWSSDAESVRQKINAFYKSAQSGCDGIVDQDVATHDPRSPLQYRPSFNAGDYLHPNDAGMVAIANSVNLGFFTPSGVPPIGTIDPKRCGTMLSGQGFQRDQPLISCDGRFQALLQQDGNLVIYQDGTPLGSTNTVGSGASTATLLADGAFALYSASGKTVWQTQSAGLLGAVMLMQNDGNLVLYDSDTASANPVWASNTFARSDVHPIYRTNRVSAARH